MSYVFCNKMVIQEIIVCKHQDSNPGSSNAIRLDIVLNAKKLEFYPRSDQCSTNHLMGHCGQSPLKIKVGNMRIDLDVNKLGLIICDCAIVSRFESVLTHQL